MARQTLRETFDREVEEEMIELPLYFTLLFGIPAAAIGVANLATGGSVLISTLFIITVPVAFAWFIISTVLFFYILQFV